MSLIRVENLSKNFSVNVPRGGVVGSVKDLFFRERKEVLAVDSISFEVSKGELIGYIGPNGAGKSTSIKMLTGILKPSSGTLRVDGFEPFRDRKQYTKNIGVVFGQRTQLWWDIAVIESFNLLKKIYEVPDSNFKQRLDDLTEILRLGDLLKTPVRKLSLGQRVRCDLAASLLHDPALVFLDEPTIGLDAITKDSVRKFLREINKNFGTTIILTTHDLQEIEELCKRIIILDKGSIVYDGDLSAIKSLPGLKKEIIIDFSEGKCVEKFLQSFETKLEIKKLSERRISAKFDSQKNKTVDLLKEIISEYTIFDISIQNPTIEEVIMKIYKDGV